MSGIELRIDGPFLIGRMPQPVGSLGAPGVVRISLDGAEETVLVDRTGARNTHSLSMFVHRLAALPAAGSTPVISVRDERSGAEGRIVWRGQALELAHWLARLDPLRWNEPPDLPGLARAFIRHAWLHPLAALRNRLAVERFARDLSILLCAHGQAGEAARLLATPPIFASLRASDIALYEALRIIADTAPWKDKRRLAMLLTMAGYKSPTAGAFAARMRLSAGRAGLVDDIGHLRAIIGNAGANPVLSAFAAETLVLYGGDAGLLRDA